MSKHDFMSFEYQDDQVVFKYNNHPRPIPKDMFPDGVGLNNVTDLCPHLPLPPSTRLIVEATLNKLKQTKQSWVLAIYPGKVTLNVFPEGMRLDSYSAAVKYTWTASSTRTQKNPSMKH